MEYVILSDQKSIVTYIDELDEKLKKDNEITEDEQKDGEKKLQDITDDFVKQADSITKKKEEEILSI